MHLLKYIAIYLIIPKTNTNNGNDLGEICHQSLVNGQTRNPWGQWLKLLESVAYFFVRSCPSETTEFCLKLLIMGSKLYFLRVRETHTEFQTESHVFIRSYFRRFFQLIRNRNVRKTKAQVQKLTPARCLKLSTLVDQ